MLTTDEIITDPAIADRRDLGDASCEALLRDAGWGVLSVVEITPEAARPYGIPVSYAFDGEVVYMASGPGRKREALQASGRVCLTVFDVAAFDRWTTVVVEGRATPITDVAEPSRIVPEHIADGLNDDDGAGRTMDAIRRLVRSLRSSSAESERQLGLSAAQLFALRQIAAQPNQSLSELARRTLTTQSSVSEVITRLVDRGFVSRDVSIRDRRRAELSLTDAGERLLANVPETIQEKLVAGFNRLTPIQQAGLAGGLEAWLAEAGLSETPPTMFFEPMVGERESVAQRV